MGEKTYTVITRSGDVCITGISEDYATAFKMDLIKLGTPETDIEIRREKYESDQDK